MMPTVEMIVQVLLTEDYKEVGGSDVFRILVHNKTKQILKIFYNDYDNQTEIIIKESVPGYNE